MNVTTVRPTETPTDIPTATPKRHFIPFSIYNSNEDILDTIGINMNPNIMECALRPAMNPTATPTITPCLTPTITPCLTPTVTPVLTPTALPCPIPKNEHREFELSNLLNSLIYQITAPEIKNVVFHADLSIMNANLCTNNHLLYGQKYQVGLEVKTITNQHSLFNFLPVVYDPFHKINDCVLIDVLKRSESSPICAEYVSGFSNVNEIAQSYSDMGRTLLMKMKGIQIKAFIHKFISNSFHEFLDGDKIKFLFTVHYLKLHGSTYTMCHHNYNVIIQIQKRPLPNNVFDYSSYKQISTDRTFDPLSPAFGYNQVVSDGPIYEIGKNVFN